MKKATKVKINIEITDEVIKTYLESPEGKRQVVRIVEQAMRDDKSRIKK